MMWEWEQWVGYLCVSFCWLQAQHILVLDRPGLEKSYHFQIHPAGRDFQGPCITAPVCLADTACIGCM